MMAGYSEGKMTLEKTSVLNDDVYMTFIARPHNLTSGSIAVGEVEKHINIYNYNKVITDNCIKWI